MVITVPVAPQPKRRIRASASGGRVVTYKDRATRIFERSVALYLRQYAPLHPIEGPVAITLAFVHARPRRLLQNTTRGKPIPDGLIPKATTPDIDNLCKAVFDSAQVAGFFRDDCQVSELHALDFYAERSGKPRIEISIKPQGVSDAHED